MEQQQTGWGYAVSYRAHFNETWVADGVTGWVTSERQLSEIEIQEALLRDLPDMEGMPDGVRPEDIIITRFHYTEVPSVSVPDVSQTGQAEPDTDRTQPSARPDTEPDS